MKRIRIANVGMSFASYGRTTRKAKFLIELDMLVTWGEFCALIKPHGNGRPPIGLQRILRIHFLRAYFNLADEACEEARDHTPLFREFAQIGLGCERLPDGTTLLRFDHLLEAHELAQAMFARLNTLLDQRGLSVNCESTAAPWPMPPSSPRPARPRTRPNSAVHRCIKQKR
jgi:transposase, IS5 family